MQAKVENMAYGGFWIRCLAYVVDSVIVTIAALVGAVSAFLGVATVGSIVVFLLMLLYWPVMQASAGHATYGKALLGLKSHRLRRRAHLVPALARARAEQDHLGVRRLISREE